MILVEVVQSDSQHNISLPCVDVYSIMVEFLNIHLVGWIHCEEL